MKKLYKVGSAVYIWYENNLAKIILILLVHIGLFFLINLPYINIFIDKYFLYFIDWLLILVFFLPPKRFILKTGFILLLLACLFTLIRLRQAAEIIGDVSFMMIFTFVLLDIKEHMDIYD